MSNWDQVSIGEVAEIVSGSTPPSGEPEYWGGDVKWITPKELGGATSTHVGTTERTLTQAGRKACGARVLPVGSVLFSSRAPIGHTAIVASPMATNQGFKSFVPSPALNSRFLLRWLRAHRRQLEAMGTGATFKEVSKRTVERVSIPLPPLDEQRRIADVLDRADALRAKRRETLDCLAELRTSAFEAAFPEGASEHAPSIELGSLVVPGRPITYGILKPGPDVASGVPYVRVVDIRGGRIDASGLRRTTIAIDTQYKRSRLAAGDLVMSIRGHVGRLATVPETLAGANITQDSARFSVPHESAAFIMAALQSTAVQRWMERRTKGVAVRGINISDLRRIPIPKVDLERHIAFSTQIERLTQAEEAATNSLAHLDELFASLQQRAFRGDLFDSPLPAELTDAVA